MRQGMVYSAPPIGKVLTEVAALADAGKIKPEVSVVLPLQEASEAHRMVESRHTRGKLALRVVD